MKNKKVLILGASSDIGICLTKHFLSEKWSVLAHYNENKKNLANIKDENLTCFKFNLKNIDKFKSFLSKSKIFQNVNSFISLTGFIEPSHILNSDIKSFYDHINVNYLSNFLIIQKILPKMNKNKFGRILLSSSTGVKFGGGKHTGFYSLSKYMNEFFFNNYKEFYKKNILINAIRIGVTKTKIHKKVKKKNLRKRVNLIPINRLASVTEVANYLYFYASSENTLTTNEIINISGGE